MFDFGVVFNVFLSFEYKAEHNNWSLSQNFEKSVKTKKIIFGMFDFEVVFNVFCATEYDMRDTKIVHYDKVLKKLM